MANFFKKLFGKISEPKITVQIKSVTYVPNPEFLNYQFEKIEYKTPTEVLCPSCGHRFDKILTRSRSCPKCKKYILRIKNPETKTIEFIAGEKPVYEAMSKEEYLEGAREEAISRLNRYKDAGLKYVTVSGSGDGSCPTCQKLDGKKYLIEDALKQTPLPCRECTFEHRIMEGSGYCRCLYVPYLND